MDFLAQTIGWVTPSNPHTAVHLVLVCLGDFHIKLVKCLSDKEQRQRFLFEESEINLVSMMVGNLETEMGSNKETDEGKTKSKSHRRPDIDVIRIVLTWGILLFHTALIYSPIAGYYVKMEPEQVPVWHLIGSWFTATMDVWQMPMFFFLSGIRYLHSNNISTSPIKINYWSMDP